MDVETLFCYCFVVSEITAFTVYFMMSAFADSNIEKLRTSSSDEEDQYYDAEGSVSSYHSSVNDQCILYYG